MPRGMQGKPRSLESLQSEGEGDEGVSETRHFCHHPTQGSKRPRNLEQKENPNQGEGAVRQD